MVRMERDGAAGRAAERGEGGTRLFPVPGRRAYILAPH
jgi:hypothetical protein